MASDWLCEKPERKNRSGAWGGARAHQGRPGQAVGQHQGKQEFGPFPGPGLAEVRAAVRRLAWPGCPNGCEKHARQQCILESLTRISKNSVCSSMQMQLSYMTVVSNLVSNRSGTLPDSLQYLLKQNVIEEMCYI